MPEIILSPNQMALGRKEIPPGIKTKLSTGKLIDRKDWFSTDYLRQFVPLGKCQFNQPSCNSYATGKVWQTKYAQTVGKPGYVRPVSYSALHQELTGGNLSDGSMPLDAIELIQSKGLFRADSSLPDWFDRVRHFTSDEQNQRKL